MTAKNRPTKKQQELLSFIDGFIKGNGYGPSYRETMRALGYKSVSTVATHINALMAKGLLVKNDYSARSLEVLSDDKTIDGNYSKHEIKTIIAKLKSDTTKQAEIETLEKALSIIKEFNDAKN